MKHYLYPFLVLFFAAPAVRAQQFQLDFDNLNALAVPAPGTQLPGQVNEATGKVSLQIPLFNIQHNNFSMPVAAAYQSSGIRVDESASRIGLGWSLLAGGSITHVVCGYPDDDPTKGSDLPSVKTMMNTASPGIMQGIYKGEYDGETDYYVFQAGPISGRFFRKDGVYHLMPMGPEKIERGTYFDKPGWRITDGNGIKYYFTLTEYVSVCDQPGGSPLVPERAQTWHLTRVVFPDQQVVALDYSSESTYDVKGGRVEKAVYLKLPTLCPGAVTSNRHRLKELYMRYRSCRLQRIRYQEGSIDFHYYPTQREDVVGDYAIKTVLFRNALNKVVKQYHFEYAYKARVGTGITHASPLSKRMMLQRITPQEKEGPMLPAWQFTYNDATPEVCLPAPGTASQDIYGYFNNENATSMYTPTTPTLLKRFSYQYKEDPQNSAWLTDVIDGAERNFHNGHMQDMILQKVTYPEGAIKSFEFEPNMVVDPSTNNVVQGPGLRVSRIITDDGNGNKTYLKYTYVNGMTTERKTFPVYEINAHAYCWGNYTIEQQGNNRAFLVTSNPRALIPGLYGSNVYYGQVIRTETDASGNELNGKTVMYYYAEPLKTIRRFEYPPSSSTMSWRDTKILLAQPYFYGAPLKESLYKAETSGYTLIRETTFEYNFNDTFVNYALALYPRPRANSEDYFLTQYEGDVWTHGFHGAWYCSQSFHLNKVTSRNLGTHGTEMAWQQKRMEYEPQQTAKHFMPIASHTLLPDSTSLTTIYRRVADINITGFVTDERVNALVQLQANNQYGAPVEIVKWKDYGTPMAQVISASLQEFTRPVSSIPLVEPKKSFTLKRIPQGTLFTYANVNSNSFEKSNAYVLNKEVTGFNEVGSPVSASMRSDQKSYLQDANNLFPIATIENAKASECAYASFEKWEADSLSALGLCPLGGFQSTTPTFATEGFSGSRSLQLTSSCSLNVAATTVLDPTRTYVLTLRCKNGTPTVSFGNPVVQNITPTVMQSNRGWTLMQYRFSGANPPFISGTCLIDEVRMHPTDAMMSTITYDIYGQPCFTGSPNNQLLQTEYDSKGRRYREYDTDGKLLRQFDYGTLETQP